MSKIWLTQHTFDELWALTHNFRLRMASNVKTAAVSISGNGKRACVNILLPAQSPASGDADFPFKVTLGENNTLDILSGYLNRNGEFLAIPEKSGFTPATGVLCLKSTITDGKWTDPEFVIQQPAADAYPIAEISVEEKDGNKTVSIRQFPVTVAIILLAKHCPLTRE